MFDAIALVILAGMMLIPFVNIVVGLIVGAGVGGVFGAVTGLLLSVLVIAAEKLIGHRLGLFDPRPALASALPQATAYGRARLTRRRTLVLRAQRQRPVLRPPIYFTEPAPLRPPGLMVAILRDASLRDGRQSRRYLRLN
ncbi:MAG: hypothetical protein Q8L61_00190 [Hyphomicrobium sp.]|jgi:hypothetical protein|nr:hypothetical protein [Hyphomicrobium sp.]